MIVSESQLRAFLPSMPHPEFWAPALDSACSAFIITAPVRLAAFLAQVAHESGGFTRVVENLSYSTPDRIRLVWRFPTVESARPYVRQPEALANKVYSDRLGNGAPSTGDGWKFRGRGLIQLTGRANYRAAGLALGIALETQPELAEQPAMAALTAAWFWESKNLNFFADQNTLEAFDKISIRINGGQHGLMDRRALWVRAKAALA
jgi:putative chitinase